MEGVISLDLARALSDAHMPWVPSSGDRFVIPDRDMDDEVFHVAEMTIEVASHQGAGIVKFNGTTEWALDSIPTSSAVAALRPARRWACRWSRWHDRPADRHVRRRRHARPGA